MEKVRAFDQEMDSCTKENPRETRHTGRIMDTDVGKISSSAVSVSNDSSGTSTIPPPAPKSPFTAPAQIPAKMMGKFFFIIK